MPIFNGTDSADALTGTTGDDTINALGGNDVINATSGVDTVNGGPGSDRLNIKMQDAALFATGGTGAAAPTLPTPSAARPSPRP